MKETTVEDIKQYLVKEATAILAKTFTFMTIPLKEGRDLTKEEEIELANLVGRAEAIAGVAKKFGWVE